MIRAKIIRAGEQILGFECKGHAGYAEEGSDIICAAVSILTTTCVNALESVAGVKGKAKVDEGYMQVLIEKDQANHDTQVIFRTVIQGLRDLTDAYPEYLQLKEN